MRGGSCIFFCRILIDEILQVVEAIPVIADEEIALLGKNLQTGPFLCFASSSMVTSYPR